MLTFINNNTTNLLVIVLFQCCLFSHLYFQQNICICTVMQFYLKFTLGKNDNRQDSTQHKFIVSLSIICMYKFVCIYIYMYIQIYIYIYTHTHTHMRENQMLRIKYSLTTVFVLLPQHWCLVIYCFWKLPIPFND